MATDPNPVSTHITRRPRPHACARGAMHQHGSLQSFNIPRSDEGGGDQLGDGAGMKILGRDGTEITARWTAARLNRGKRRGAWIGSLVYDITPGKMSGCHMDDPRGSQDPPHMIPMESNCTRNIQKTTRVGFRQGFRRIPHPGTHVVIVNYRLGMETIKIPSPSTILHSPDTLPASARGKPASPPRKAKRIATASQKPKQTKSRNGCITCKAKRLKCDETKPTCHQCERRKVPCGGYKKDFKWRPFEETILTVARPTATKAKKANAPSQPPPISVANSESFLTPPTTEQSGSPIRPLSNCFNASPPESSLHSSPQSVKSFLSTDTHSPDGFVVPRDEVSTRDESTLNGGVSIPVDSDPLNFLSFLEPFQQSVPFSDDLLSAQDLSGSGPFDFGLQEFQPAPGTGNDELSFARLLEDDSEGIEEIIRQSDPGAGSWNFSFSGQDDGSFDFPHFPSQPPLAPESQEMLAMRFDKMTCGILSIKDGMTENPWRTLIWPLAKSTPALYHAIFALSAFHSAKEKPSLRVQGVKHMRQSITCLRQQIQSMRADTALATSLALAFADTWDQNTRTCIQHLRGAKALMLQVLNAGLEGGLQPEELDRIRFLYNTWTYMDVIARLTSLDESGPQDLNPSIFQLPGDAVHEIDPLMGCAATLFPLIGKVARLVQRVRKTSTNSVSIVSQAMELKALVEQWEPPRWFAPPEDPTSEVQHSIQMAHAYRWATLLYLHQAVPELPSEPAEELAKRVLILLATVPPTSRTTIIQMFPLLAAGAEVDVEEDRKWVLERWSVVQSRLMIGGVDRCLDVIREVWARRDELQAKQQQQDMFSTRRPRSFSTENNVKLNSQFQASDNSGRGFHGRVNSCDHSDRSMQGRSGPIAPESGQSRRGSALSSLENIKFERTVRSRSHWVNVMGEWGWEVFLG
ncbi:uncharacterized protein N7482_005018 [Penicillium canariense]|uniref:Zn(2)-C6 fungal-type domain-containing protein n=1 Tax=Penicillium canariense TaxID=189055 RepID=A0A9W9I5U1_9EURO|nr:uncharacterized protein N7482_005018 [Penicillium canariense]KAJ5166237.1 hypothetical protein N7482_005018 [Penicillium canariense]